MSSRRTTVDANGNLVAVSSASTASSTEEGADAASALGSLQSLNSIDVFGFNVPVRQFWMGLAVVLLLMGLKGVFGVLMALGCYTLYMRSTGRTLAGAKPASYGRAKARGWQGFGGGGGSTTAGSGPGSNIRGIADLPCDPKVG